MFARSFLSFLALSAAFQAGAQFFGGNNQKVNRKNQVSIVGVETESQQWESRKDPGISVSIYFRSANDSVIVFRNGMTAGYFLSRYDRIISPRLVLADEKGSIQSIDSFRLAKNEQNAPYDTRYKDEYYNSFSASLAVRWQYYSSGIPWRALYRDISGHDSLALEWSPAGILRHRKLGKTEYSYSAGGLLSAVDSENNHLQYENGILISIVNDTVILNQLVKRVRNYSPKGILQKESWFKDEKPVASWREYNSEGVLVKTTKHQALTEAIASIEISEMPYDEIFLHVSQSAEYIGGMGAFYEYVKSELFVLFTSGDMPLYGRYAIRFEIPENGIPVYLSAKGANVASIDRSLKTTLEKMPRWSASKRNGRPVRETIVLTIDIRLKN